MTYLLQPLLFAFVPIGCLAFLLNYLSYRNGEVRPEDDRHDDWDMAVDGVFDEDRPSNNLLHKKWLSYGGGYYGLMVLVTITYIEGLELLGLYQIRSELPGIIAALDRDTVLEIFKSQIMNLVDAFVWFQYWPHEIAISNGWVWLGLSYAGYWCGEQLGRRLV